jgi:hypothetical protein
VSWRPGTKMLEILKKERKEREKKNRRKEE